MKCVSKTYQHVVVHSKKQDTETDGEQSWQKKLSFLTLLEAPTFGQLVIGLQVDHMNVTLGCYKHFKTISQLIKMQLVAVSHTNIPYICLCQIVR